MGLHEVSSTLRCRLLTPLLLHLSKTFVLRILGGFVRVCTPASIEALADPYSLRAINLLQEMPDLIA